MVYGNIYGNSMVIYGNGMPYSTTVIIISRAAPLSKNRNDSSSFFKTLSVFKLLKIKKNTELQSVCKLLNGTVTTCLLRGKKALWTSM